MLDVDSGDMDILRRTGASRNEGGIEVSVDPGGGRLITATFAVDKLGAAEWSQWCQYVRGELREREARKERAAYGGSDSGASAAGGGPRGPDPGVDRQDSQEDGAQSESRVEAFLAAEIAATKARYTDVLALEAAANDQLLRAKRDKLRLSEQLARLVNTLEVHSARSVRQEARDKADTYARSRRPRKGRGVVQDAVPEPEHGGQDPAT